MFLIEIDRSGISRNRFVSEGAREIFGVPPQVILEDADLVMRYLHPDDQDRLAADLRTVVQSAAFKQKAQEQGATADYQTPAQLGDKVKADLANWAQVVKTSKIEAE